MSSMRLPQRGAQVRHRFDGVVGEVCAVDAGNQRLTLRWPLPSGSNRLTCTLDEFAYDWELTGKRVGGVSVTKSAEIALAVLGVCLYGWHRVGASSNLLPSSVIAHRTAVVDGRPVLEVTIRLRRQDTAASDLISAIADMKSVMQGAEQWNDEAGGVTFHLVDVTPGGFDDYGNPTPAHATPAFDIHYSADELRRINWKQVDELKLANLGKVSQISYAGMSVARDYCSYYRESSNVFCAEF